MYIYIYMYVRRTPHPVKVFIRDNRDYIRVLLYSYYTTITGWGVLLIYIYIWVCVCVCVCVCVYLSIGICIHT